MIHLNSHLFRSNEFFLRFERFFSISTMFDDWNDCGVNLLWERINYSHQVWQTIGSNLPMEFHILSLTKYISIFLKAKEEQKERGREQAGKNPLFAPTSCSFRESFINAPNAYTTTSNTSNYLAFQRNDE